MDLALLVARLVLALVLAVAGFAKLTDPAGSRAAVTGFGLPSALARALATLVPVAELVIAILLLPVATAAWAALAALVLLAVFTGAIAFTLSRGGAPECNCFGVLSRQPVGTGTLIRNGVLMALAAFVAVAGWDGAGDSLPRRLTSLPAAAMVGILVVAAFALSIASMAWLGRVRPSEEPDVDDDDDFGLAPGAEAPAFQAEDLDGFAVSLSQLRQTGLPTLLVFADPGCGSCAALLPDVTRWQHELAGDLTVVVVASGEPERVRSEIESRAVANVVVQHDRAVSDAYRIAGTPAAVVVGPDGRIARDVAHGGDEIQLLMDRELWRVPLNREP
jgi:uncharacterized membrane protein YphA (DoxX/SURF4 family)/thiol-disulfide isomerase/thioredoxin